MGWDLLEVEHSAEQLNSSLLADADCHDTFMQCKEKQQGRKCTCILARHESWHPQEDSQVKDIAMGMLQAQFCRKTDPAFKPHSQVSCRLSHVVTNHLLYLQLWVVLLLVFLPLLCLQFYLLSLLQVYPDSFH